MDIGEWERSHTNVRKTSFIHTHFAVAKQGGESLPQVLFSNRSPHQQVYSSGKGLLCERGVNANRKVEMCPV